MARRISKDYVKVNGQPVTGIWKNGRGFYVRNPHKQGTDKREYFANLSDAVARRDNLAGVSTPTVTVKNAADDAEGELLSLGLAPDHLTPDVVERARTTITRVNPNFPDQEYAGWLLLKSVHGGETYEDFLHWKTTQSTRGAYTVARVGKDYVRWYLGEREDLDDLKRKADAYNATRNGKKRRTPADFAKPINRRSHREYARHFAEFVKIVGDLPIDRLKGADFTKFSDKMKSIAAARSKQIVNGKPKVSEPARWRAQRFKCVQAAFRRAMKLKPDESWPQELERWLLILESKGLDKEGPKTLITPAEFKVMLDVADTQWKAILRLSMNAALANRDVSEICWRHLDLDKAVMTFPRPKNGRLRQTPLLPATVTALENWRTESKSTTPDVPVFLTWQGTKWITTTDSIGKHWDLLRQQAEAKGTPVAATFKALRKSASSAVMAAKVGQASLAVDMLLGHASNKTWRFYVGFSPDFLIEAVNAIGCEFGS